jgi:hypothetical protein
MRTQLSLLDAAPAVAPKATAPGEIVRSAIISPCGKFRYRLARSWGIGREDLWVCCNPSTADAERDDASLLRMMGFSQAWGSAGIEVVNLAAFRSPHPDALYDALDPVGPLNDRHIRDAAEHCHATGGRLVAGWGASLRFDDLAPPALIRRDVQVLELLRTIGVVWCIGRTSSGAPKHPLARGKHRVPDDVKPEPYTP